jgi:hypothetical protein
MGKKKEGWQLGEGPYSKASEGLPMTKDESQRTYSPPKDISRKVDRAWQVNDGFDGALPPSKE